MKMGHIDWLAVLEVYIVADEIPTNRLYHLSHMTSSDLPLPVGYLLVTTLVYPTQIVFIITCAL